MPAARARGRVGRRPLGRRISCDCQRSASSSMSAGRKPPTGVRALARCYDIADVARLARRRLPAGALGYLEGSSEGEWTLRRNREVFGEVEVELVPRVLRDMGRIDTTSTVLGQPAVVPALPVGRPLRRQGTAAAGPGGRLPGTAADRRHDRPVAPAPGAGAGDQPARTDVVTALALGAKALLIGRAHLYGLAAAGEAGVRHAIERCAGRPRHRARGRGPGRGALPSCPARTHGRRGLARTGHRGTRGSRKPSARCG